MDPHQEQNTEVNNMPVAPAAAAQPAQTISPTEVPNNLPPTSPPPATQGHTDPLPVILQWLTYAFWGWTILGMSILTVSVLSNFVSGADTGGFTPYAIAAVLVLLPISIVCDFFYSKKEPIKKTGAASLVMVIHAVLFALFGIGAVIAIVISLVTKFTSSSDSENSTVAMYSSIIIAILYAAIFLRTINLPKFFKLRRFFVLFMTLVVGVISFLGVIGPVAHERATRNDRLIESNLSTVQQSINDFANKNHTLPQNLGALDLNGDSKMLVDKNLVKYTPNTKTSTSTPKSNNLNYYSNAPYSYSNNTASTFYYQLCVTFAKKSKNQYPSYSSTLNDADGYSAQLDTYNGHDAGQKCYNLKTTDYFY